MKKLVMHRDGRLRIGLVTLAVFGLLFALGTLLLKCRVPMNEAVVAIRQVWEPDTGSEKQPVESTEPQEPRQESRQESPQEPETQAPASDTASAASPVVGGQPEAMVQKTDPPAVTQEPEGEASGLEPEAQDLKAQKPREPSPDGQLQTSQAAWPDGGVVANGVNDVGEHTVAETPVDAPVAHAGTGEAQAAPIAKQRPLTVDAKAYSQLLETWRSSGVMADVPSRIPLQVTDLRSSYALLQMKPVAIVDDTIIIDLADGSRLPQGVLDSYSAIVFEVDRPWDKWGQTLKTAGVNRNQRIEVRYYMYEFMRRAIYARCRQAVNWCRDQGLVDREVATDRIEVLGRTFVIQRRGGGRFGVFVPVRLTMPGGRQVAIDPAAFVGQADVEALGRAGLL